MCIESGSLPLIFTIWGYQGVQKDAVYLAVYPAYLAVMKKRGPVNRMRWGDDGMGGTNSATMDMFTMQLRELSRGPGRIRVQLQKGPEV